MRPNNVLQSEKAYKRGLILGLTMAEIILLLLFSLLLALAALSLDQEKKMDNIRIERDKYAEELRINEDKLKILMATLSRSDLSSMKKELVRLKEQEQQIALLLDRLEIDENTPAAERLDQLFEKTTKLNEVAKTLDNAGFPPEPKELESALNRVKDAQAEIVKADKALEYAKNEKEQMAQDLEDAEQGLSQKDGQIANMKRTLGRFGKGTEKPACWADEKTGKAIYIYNAGLTSDGIIIRHSATPPWAKARQLPIDAIPYDKTLSPREFIRKADPIFQWSEKNECRFYVRAYDLTGPTEKKIYKRHTRYLESAFYKYEVLNDNWE
tara:strand:+ start:16352 stop:17329 length:978 start_codon:yes stop_codon:yes gene_type:complete